MTDQLEVAVNGSRFLWAVGYVSRECRRTAMETYRAALIAAIQDAFGATPTSHRATRELESFFRRQLSARRNLLVLSEASYWENIARQFVACSDFTADLEMSLVQSKLPKLFEKIESLYEIDRFAAMEASFIAGILRSLDEIQLMEWAGDRADFDYQSAHRSFLEIRQYELTSLDAIFGAFSELIQDHFVRHATWVADRGSLDRKAAQEPGHFHSRMRPRGTVSRAASRSYLKAWRDFLDREAHEIWREANTSVNQPYPAATPALREIVLRSVDSMKTVAARESAKREREKSPASSRYEWLVTVVDPRNDGLSASFPVPAHFIEWGKLESWLSLAAEMMSDAPNLGASVVSKSAEVPLELHLKPEPAALLAAKLIGIMSRSH